MNALAKHQVDPALLGQLFKYCPESGKLFWRTRPDDCTVNRRFNTRYSGKETGTIDVLGRRCVAIRHYGSVVWCFAHRIAWAIYYGEWPSGEIDHINLKTADNRICNLREASRGENSRNRSVQKNCRAGLKGVDEIPNDKWRARITLDKRRIHIGVFSSKEDAARAYDAAAHALHKDFARTNFEEAA